MMLHGGMGSPAIVAEQTSLLDYLDRDRFIGVFPDAGGRQWNDGRPTTACDDDDVAFLAAIVGAVAERHGGDPERAFLAGGSNGGMMAQRVACEAPDTFRAYAVVHANLPAGLEQKQPLRPVPILFILSTDDPGMPWHGGVIAGGKTIGAGGRLIGAGGRVLSALDTVDFFARANGCTGIDIADLATADGTRPGRMHQYRCRLNPVVLYEIHGGGHGWPGSRAERSLRVSQKLGAVSQEIDATAVILDFFRQNGLGHRASAAAPENSSRLPTNPEGQFAELLRSGLQETALPSGSSDAEIAQRIDELNYRLEMLRGLRIVLQEELDALNRVLASRPMAETPAASQPEPLRNRGGEKTRA